MRSSRKMLVMAAAIVVAVAAWMLLPGRGPSGPSIVILLVDTVRQDALSCYGHPGEATPHIDRLAGEGTLFLKATASAPWTGPSVASIFTGQFAPDHGYHLENAHLDEDRTCIAEVLRDAGYQTVGFSCNPFVSEAFGMTQGFDLFEDTWRERERGADWPDEGADRLVELTRKWLDETRDPDRPFFLYLHFMEPHLPYTPPAPYDGKFVGEGMDPDLVTRVRGWETPRELAYIFGVETVERDEFAALRTQYAGEVGYVDEKIGDLVEVFRQRGLLDELLIILTSDHGENIGDHDLMDHKFCLYNTLLRVPLILRYPPRMKAGARISRPVQIQDIFPTILDVTGLEGKAAAATPSLLEEGGEDRSLLAHHFRPIMFLDKARSAFPEIDAGIFERRLASVERDGWKLIWTSDDKPELYDIRNDPGETRNVHADHPEKAASLEKMIRGMD